MTNDILNILSLANMLKSLLKYALRYNINYNRRQDRSHCLVYRDMQIRTYLHLAFRLLDTKNATICEDLYGIMHGVLLVNIGISSSSDMILTAQHTDNGTHCGLQLGRVSSLTSMNHNYEDYVPRKE